MERKPNFLFIGPSRSGSTWLYEVLAWHPEVFMPRAKELFFFDRYFHFGETWYLNYFRDAQPEHSVVGEISHDYLPSREAADRIAISLPGVKLMACLREPVERAFSHYLFLRQMGVLEMSFEEAMRDCDYLVDYGLYAKHLEPYFDRFGADALYVPLFDDLKADTNQFAQGVFRFLDVQEKALPEELCRPVNEASQPRSSFVARYVLQAALLTRKFGRPDLVNQMKSTSLMQRVLYRTYRREDRPRLDAGIHARLKHLFHDDVVRLGDCLDRDVASQWGYLRE